MPNLQTDINSQKRAPWLSQILAFTYSRLFGSDQEYCSGFYRFTVIVIREESIRTLNQKGMPSNVSSVNLIFYQKDYPGTAPITVN